MCGIVGVVHRDRGRPVEEGRLVAMRDLLTHRGPDDAGAYVAGGVGLGHRRLSIIDLSGGRQPMSNEDGSMWIVFNGEIYNYRELREELVAKGHRFHSRSDTEVLLHLYEEEGPGCVRRLNGIFAFAIWNVREQSLFLARDHMGVKPLYYALTEDALVFASEIKSVVGSGYLKAECRDDAIFEYFVYRQVSGRRTLFRGVECLLPAHTLVYRNGTVEVSRYWSPVADEQGPEVGFASAADALADLIEDAVRLQLVSDVPLGTFCSGGVDSSLVTALAAQITKQPINTFSVGFHEDGYDETEFARLVASRYSTAHHEVRIGNREFADLLPTMIWHHDSPLNFANSIQIFALSKLAKTFVTVVLTGEGADELFVGYPRYLIPGLAGRYRRVPEVIRRVIAGHAFGGAMRRLQKIDRCARYTGDEALLYNAAFLEPGFVSEVLRTEPHSHLEYRWACLRGARGAAKEGVAQLSLLDQQNYLVSILERQDKMSMAASIESRVPFLDHRLVEFANALPVKYKSRAFRTKAVLKRVARRYLPGRVVERRKSGFGVPLRDWMKDASGMGRFVTQLLDDPSMDGVADGRRMERIVAQHRSGEADHSELLWTAINFMLWRRSLAR